jgi:hypothetical protein
MGWKVMRGPEKQGVSKQIFRVLAGVEKNHLSGSAAFE